MRRNEKTVITILFLLIVVVLGCRMNTVLRKKWGYGENAAQQIVQGYYKEGEGMIDVLALGASTIRNGISPLYMYHSYGFTAYSRATSMQPPFISYYLLEETLGGQEIKAVIMDASNLFALTNNIDDMDGKMHEAIDYMRFGRDKLNIIKELTDRGYSAIDFLIPVYKYHERWTELTKEDFTYMGWDGRYVYKGQFPNMVTAKYDFPPDYMSVDIENDHLLTLDDEAVAYYDRMIALCKEKNIYFILLKTPVSGWSMKKNDLIQQYAGKNGILFVDFNLPQLQQEIGFCPEEDFSDEGKHLNLSGANKISKYIGKIINAECDFADKRGMKGYAAWDEAYGLYQRMMYDKEIASETNADRFFQLIKDNDYTIIIASRDNSWSQFETLSGNLKKIGLGGNMTSQEYISYLAIINGSEVLYENMMYGNPVSFNEMVNNNRIIAMSYADRVSGNTASITINGDECSPQKAGINIVVVDNKINRVIAKRVMGPGAGDLKK